jgi:hypothetical protein
VPSYSTLFAPGLLALILTACATPGAPPATARTPPVGAATPTATIATPHPEGSVMVCDDQASTGSNIRRRHCYLETEEMRRAKQQQIDALHQGAPVNAAKPTGIQ